MRWCLKIPLIYNISNIGDGIFFAGNVETRQALSLRCLPLSLQIFYLTIITEKSPSICFA